MDIVKRLRMEHDELLLELGRLEEMLNGLGSGEVPAFISRLWGLVQGLEKHEEFEDRSLLIPLADGADAAVLKDVERARREHDGIFGRLTEIHKWLSDGRGLTPKKWSEGHREMIRALANRAYGELRDHIRWENEALLSPNRREPPEERESWRRWS